MCHIILLLPLLTLPLFFVLPFSTALPIYLVILIMTWFLYYKILVVMKSKVQTGIEALIDEDAAVVEDINPEGKILVWSEIWSATANGKKFLKGQKVKICGFYGLKAIVCESVEG